MVKRASLLVVVVGLTAVATLMYLRPGRHPHATAPASQPTTVAAATQFVRKPRVPATVPVMPTYYEVVNKLVPAVASTQPLAMPAELEDAAHLVFHDPVYLDPSGHLWITRPDGFSLKDALAKPGTTNEHVVTQLPVFVHWWMNEAGVWAAAAVVRETNGFVLVTRDKRKPLPISRQYRWQSGFSSNGRMIVPTDTGVSVFDVEPDFVEHYHALPGATGTGIRRRLCWTRVAFGLGAVGTCQAGQHGREPVRGRGVVRPAGRVVAEETDPVVDAARRQRAVHGGRYRDAGRRGNLGPGRPGRPDRRPAGSAATGHGADQRLGRPVIRPGPAEAAGGVRGALGVRAFGRADFGEAGRGPNARGADSHPAVAAEQGHSDARRAPRGRRPVGGRPQVRRRVGTDDRAGGVEFRNAADETETVEPAWLLQRPDGRPDHVLPDGLVREQKPDRCTLQYAREEWVVSDDGGTKRFVGGDYEPLLPPSEKKFDTLVGIANHRRWLFRSSRDPNGDTLIVDPTVADPTPKLPVWTITLEGGTVGWDDENFPLIDRGEHGGLWELAANGWRAMKETEPMHTDVRAATRPSTTGPTTLPALVATTAPTTMPAGLLVDHGVTYTDGNDTLTVQTGTGPPVVWHLPAEATGTATPILVKTPDGLLFLYNQPGRLLRIRPTPGAADPLKLDATFTTDIPNDDHPRRIWIDPAGRIDWIDEGNALHVMFPAGRIPREISEMMVKETGKSARADTFDRLPPGGALCPNSETF